MGDYHVWGDEDFDWKALDEACAYLSDNCRKWGRVGIWVKEKYGTMRISTTCAFVTEYDFLHSIFYPGHAFIRWPKWVRMYIDRPISRCLYWAGITKLVSLYQIEVFKYFWKKAAKKWPHIAEEILDEYNWTFGENNE